MALWKLVSDSVWAAINRQAKEEADRAAVGSARGKRVVETGASTRVLSPQELQVKSLADKALGLKQQAKMMKARQQFAKAQQALLKAQH
jgi:hypothetical protein